LGNSPLEILSSAATDVGKKREHNEDSFIYDKAVHLYVVADGMGGHAAGEVASAIAVRQVREHVLGGKDTLQRFERGEAGREDVKSLIEGAFQKACKAVYQQAQEDAGKHGMGTTCSALLICRGPEGERGFIGHVGDSRVYVLRNNDLNQLTEDHSLVNELVRRGKLKRDEIDSSPYKDVQHAMTRAVGVYDNVEVDTFDFDVLRGDTYLLCSDGLSHYLTEDMAKEILGSKNVREMPDRFVELANEGGGHDNITNIVVQVSAPDPTRPDHRAADVTLKVEVLKQMPIFKNLTYWELVRVLNVTEARAYDPGATIIKENEEGEELYIVLDGRVRLEAKGQFIVTLGRGHHFGEMALIDREPRSASAIADGAARVLSLHRRDFYEIVRKESAVGVKLLFAFVQSLSDRLRKTTVELSGARLAAQAQDLSGEIAEE
jgi:serine/threonine protein phosphatase PrpC/CRP-like cAMP-binding protein